MPPLWCLSTWQERVCLLLFNTMSDFLVHGFIIWTAMGFSICTVFMSGYFFLCMCLKPFEVHRSLFDTDLEEIITF